MVDKLPIKKRNIASLMATIGIIIVLILAGPVSAVRVHLSTDKAIYRTEDNIVTFITSINIQRNEIVPIKTLKLIINDGYKICEFQPDGSNSCPNIEIIPIETGDVQTGEREAKGFGFVNTGDKPKSKKTDFGYGYGFGEEQGKLGLRGELKYEIRWDIEADNVADGRYFSTLEAFAEDTETQYTYINPSASTFKVSREGEQAPSKASIINRAEIKSKAGGSIDYIAEDSDFDMQKPSFSADIRRVVEDSQEKMYGRAAINLYGEKDDSTTATLKVDVPEGLFNLGEFSKEKIEFDAVAQYTYQRTKNGVWDNGVRIGFEPPITKRGSLDVHVRIENNMIFVSSEDSDVPFSADIPVGEIKYR